MARLRSARPPRSRSSPSTPATAPSTVADLSKANDPLGNLLDRFVREPEVLKLTGLSRTTRWRLARRGEFPKSILIAESAVAWRLSDVYAWMRSKNLSQEAAAGPGGAS